MFKVTLEGMYGAFIMEFESMMDARRYAAVCELHILNYIFVEKPIEDEDIII